MRDQPFDLRLVDEGLQGHRFVGVGGADSKRQTAGGAQQADAFPEGFQVFIYFHDVPSRLVFC
jgi:hypothetical protein